VNEYGAESIGTRGVSVSLLTVISSHVLALPEKTEIGIPVIRVVKSPSVTVTLVENEYSKLPAVNAS